MELGTFGAVIKFAIDLETATHEFYTKACDKIEDVELKSMLEKIVNGCSIRIDTLGRIRRENVTEMILEPIRGLNSDSYSLNVDTPNWEELSDVVQTCLHIESRRKDFFETASLKIEFLIEAADAFERLADQNDDNLQRFEREFQ